MKREHYLACIVLPLAAIAGWLSAPSATSGIGSPEGSNATQVSSPPPAKSAERGVREKRPLPPPATWKALRERAAIGTVELQAKLVELLNTEASEVLGGGQGWLLEHLLHVDPRGTLLQVRDHCRDYQFGNIARHWCRQDPEAALQALLFDKEFAEQSKSGFGSSSPVDFRVMGARDAGKGLKMILGLPPERQSVEFFSTLLEGIALNDPGQVSGYFERIIAGSKYPENRLGELLSSFGSADPAQALAWAEKRFEGKIPVNVAGQMVEGMARTDVRAAIKVYEGMQGSEPSSHRQSAFWISHALTGQGLDESWSWIEANAPAASVEDLKGNAWSAWAWRNRGEAVERILKEPAVLLGERGSEMLDLLRNEGREKEIPAVLEKLSAEQREKLGPVLAASGVLPAEASGEPGSTAEWLARLSRDAADEGKLLESMPTDRREALAAELRSETTYRTNTFDPRLELEIMASTPEGIAGKGAQQSLARLTLMDAAEATRMVESMPPGEARNAAVKTVAMNWSVDDSSAATAWKEKMSARQ